MKISAKGDYAIRAMLDLALNYEKGLIPIQDIAGRQKIPQRYLEQVLLLLKRSGFLGSRRGASGGYSLAKPPEKINIGDIIRAIEGSIEPIACVVKSNRKVCERESICDLIGLWREVTEAIMKVVDNTTLADLCQRAIERKAGEKLMYHI